MNLDELKKSIKNLRKPCSKKNDTPKGIFRCYFFQFARMAVVFDRIFLNEEEVVFVICRSDNHTWLCRRLMMIRWEM